MVASVRSQTPTRLSAGATTDSPYGPMADCGYGNPAFYHQFFDDFDNSIGATGLYTQTQTGGTFSHAAGDGGLLSLVLGAANNNLAYIQLPAAGFQLPQGTTFPTGTLGKKLFYGCRLTSLSTLASYTSIFGLIQTTATAFTTVTDGVYFQLATAGVNLITVSASTALTWALPTSATSFMAAATQIDMAYYIDWYQNIHVFFGPQLFGFIPQSGSGTIGTNPPGISLLPEVGAVLQINGPNYIPMSGATGQTGPWTVSAANLNLTAGIKTTAATALTGLVDFHYCLKER